MVEKIKKLCSERQMSIAQLERQSEVSLGTICNWNRSIPSVDKVARVAKVLGVTIEELIA